MKSMDKILKAAGDGFTATVEAGGGEPGASVCIAREGKDGKPVAVALFVTDPEKAVRIKAAWDAIDAED